MTITRRDVMKTAAALPLGGLVLSRAAKAAGGSLPDKASFGKMDVSYFDNGSQHPITLEGSNAVERYLSKRRLDPGAPKGLHDSVVPLELFAKLINADVDEIAYVQSTTAGEQMVLRSLGLPEAGGHIVTDKLHFPGSFSAYRWMEREGMEVTWLEEKNGRIELDDVEQAVRNGTKLVALSLVSTRNGFQHDLKAVCDIAHAKGAYVYADIIHGAGCIPIDVKESGVDFAATASYKWLMGDFGLGFLYVRKDVLPKIKRTNYGYFGINAGASEKARAEAALSGGYPMTTSGFFAQGTRSFTTVAILEKSLQYIHNLGVENIQAHAQTLTDRLKEELPKLGYPLMTPPDCKTPIVSCKLDNASAILGPRLEKAKVKFSTYNDHFRISASVYNDMDDVEKLLNAVKI